MAAVQSLTEGLLFVIVVFLCGSKTLSRCGVNYCEQGDYVFFLLSFKCRFNKN